MAYLEIFHLLTGLLSLLSSSPKAVMTSLGGPSGAANDGLEAEMDALASWPALASFVDELSENPPPEEQPYPLDAGLNDISLHRSLSLPAYLGAGGLGGAGVNLSRSIRATSFGPSLLGGAGQQGLDGANAEINARLVSLLNKVRARFLAPPALGRLIRGGTDAPPPNKSARAGPIRAHFFRRAHEPLALLSARPPRARN